MKRLFTGFLLCLTALLATTDSHALVLGSFSFGGGGRSSYGTEAKLDINVFYQADMAATSLFNGFYLDKNATDQTITSTAINDPAFDDFTALLTNGQDDFIFPMLSTNITVAGNPSSESMHFQGNPNLLNGIDFQGWIIDSYDLILTNVMVFPEIVPDYSEAISAQVEFVVNGHEATNAVPEPASIFLLGSGLVGAFIRRKRS